jgi:DNA-binding NarL/FixJ family response regulator
MHPPDRALTLLDEMGAEAGSPATPTRVVLADDHPLFRAGVRERLDKHPSGIAVVGEASDGREALDLVAELQPDVVLLDISMPNMNGIEATRELKKRWPEIAVLVLTVYDDEQYIYALIDAGAAGYLLKTTGAAELGDAIQRVRQGEAVLSPAITEKVLERVISGGRIQPVASPLSERERRVLELAAQGASNKVIAAELEVSVRTVHAHMRNIFGKLGVGSRTEAVMLGVRQGWLQPGEIR